MKPWKTLTRRTVLERGRFLRVEDHAVELPDGTVIPDWAWVDTPEYVDVLPVTAQGRFGLLRQLKYAVNEPSLATVGGYIEAGEDPLAAARRELLEEMGVEAERWVALGSYVVDANRGCGKAHLFLALDARQVAERQADDLGDYEVVHLARPQVEEALMGGEFRVLGWATLVAMALHHLDGAGAARPESAPIRAGWGAGNRTPISGSKARRPAG